MKRWQIWAGIAVSALFLYIALGSLQLDQVWIGIKSAELVWLLPGIGIYLVSILIRAWRWQNLLAPLDRIPFPKSVAYVSIGYMGNNIFPARAGELLRAYVLRQKQNIPITASLMTIITERVLDGVVLIGFIFVNISVIASAQTSSDFNKLMDGIALWGSVLFFGAFILFLIAAFFPQQILVFLTALSRKILPQKIQAKAINGFNKILDGLRSLKSPKNVIVVILQTVLIWLLETGKYWFVMQAFPARVGFPALMVMNGIVNLASTVPSAPGNVGTFDAPGIAFLSFIGVDPEVAAAYTLTLHAALWLPITLIGAFYFFREGFNWKNRSWENKK